MIHPEYMGVYCRICRQDTLPLQNGTCGFCDTQLDLSWRRRREPVSARTRCLTRDCGNLAVFTRGRYARLCFRCKDELQREAV